MTNNRLTINDVVDACLTKTIVVYTANSIPFEGKLVLSNNKLIQLEVTPPNGGTAYHLYILFDDIIAVATTALINP